MKIRTSHITNSSSSSFVLAIDRKVKGSISSVEEFIEEFVYEEPDEGETVEELLRYSIGISTEELQKWFDKGWTFLNLSTGGQDSYNDGKAEKLLKLFDIKSQEVKNEYEGWVGDIEKID